MATERVYDEHGLVETIEHADDPTTEPAPAPSSVVALAQAITDALATLTPSSSSAAQRTALLALREKADAVVNEYSAG